MMLYADQERNLTAKQMVVISFVQRPTLLFSFLTCSFSIPLYLSDCLYVAAATQGLKQAQS